MTLTPPPPTTTPTLSSPHAAIDAVRALLLKVPTELRALDQVHARVLAQSVHADRDSPALDVSAMDGFAIRIADIAAMVSQQGLPVIDAAMGEARIGHPPIVMPPHHAVRIVTGAAIPVGADTVVRHEDVEHANGCVRLKVTTLAIARGANIRVRGENAKCGALITPAGNLISAATVGALASFGVAQVGVHRKVRVAIVITGDELVHAHAQPQPWQVRDSNGPVLESVLHTQAWIEIISRTHAHDDADALAATIEAAMREADAVILTGGVSMGHRDFVPQVVTRVGAHTLFHKLPQRPGRPMLAAVRPAQGECAARLILGLPGNPVAVMTTARRLVVEMLGALAGLSAEHFAPQQRSIANCDDATLSMWWYRLVAERVGANGDNELHLIEGKGSGDIAAAANSLGFVEIPPGERATGLRNLYRWL